MEEYLYRYRKFDDNEPKKKKNFVSPVLLKGTASPSSRLPLRSSSSMSPTSDISSDSELASSPLPPVSASSPPSVPLLMLALARLPAWPAPLVPGCPASSAETNLFVRSSYSKQIEKKLWSLNLCCDLVVGSYAVGSTNYLSKSEV